MAWNMNIRSILTSQINDCDCVSNAMALFCFDLGVSTISYVNFSNLIYYSSAFQFHINLLYLMQEHAFLFERHLLPCKKLYMASSYYNITFFNPLLFSKLILKFINLLVDTKSPHYFCVLHIVSNMFFTMLLICQVAKIRTDGFMCYICMGIGSILICKHDFTVYYPSSSILRIFNYQFNYFHKLFSNQI